MDGDDKHLLSTVHIVLSAANVFSLFWGFLVDDKKFNGKSKIPNEAYSIVIALTWKLLKQLLSYII